MIPKRAISGFLRNAYRQKPATMIPKTNGKESFNPTSPRTKPTLQPARIKTSKLLDRNIFLVVNMNI
jgi:hypothetical protein